MPKPAPKEFLDDKLPRSILSGLISVPQQPDSGDVERAQEIQGITAENVRTLFPEIEEGDIARKIGNGQKWAREVLEAATG